MDEAQPRFVVIGDPVAHSLSPRIHAAFGAALGIALDYSTLRAPADDFTAVLERFLAGGGRGANVTVPFKEAAFAWAGRHDRAAARAGAVNTIVPVSDGFLGANTDGAGWLADLTRLGVTIGDATVLVLGAGGAVKGLLGPLLDAGPAKVVLANRTAARAARLAEHLGDARLEVAALDGLPTGCDLVVNGTSAGLTGSTAPVAPGALAGAFCYDLVYAAGTTPFCRLARRAGARGWADGLGMLVAQAALAFELWHGVRPDPWPVLAMLRRRS